MQMLPALLMLFASRWTRGLVGAAILSTLIWTYLPMVPAFAAPLPRLAAIVGIFVLFAAGTAIVNRRRKRRERSLDAAVAGGGQQANDDAAAGAEVLALRKRLREAIATLRKRGVRRLYDLPWYIVIGPPGAGKTTALKQSGLHFPLSETGLDTLPGTDGTRLCDWWFAEEAVLIDTAGRYTTQNSNKTIDKAGWLGFLDLLRRARPRQPINGVIVVISLLELVEATPQLRDDHARAIRLRINELTEHLRLRLPIYMVFSKLDRLVGFDVFFDDLDKAGRDQVWGMTFAVDQGQEVFAAEFRLLLERLQERLIERLQGERGYDRRAIASGFPLQVASIEETLAAFLGLAFKGSRLDPAPFLRGVYLTSATQTGTPLDRLSGMLARSFGIDQKRAAGPRPVAGRSYFIGRMMRDVILGETPLVSTTAARFRFRKILHASGLGTIAALTVIVLALIWGAQTQARLAIQQMQDAFGEYRQVVRTLPQGPIDKDDDLPQVALVLNRAAGLQVTPAQHLAALFGLSSHAKLTESGRIAYLDALQHLLYPRLVWRLEQQIRAHMQDPDTLYDATRVYLLLGGFGPREPDVIRQWIEADWANRFGGVLNESLRRHLAGHLDALLAAPLPSRDVPLDNGLISQARADFSHVTPAERIYDRLRVMSGGSAAIGWSPQLALGDAAAQTFVRPSGASLSEGIPAFLTGRSFAAVMSRDLPPAARIVADESWVVGRDPGIVTDGAGVGTLERDVAQLWANDARAHWDALLHDLALRPFGDRQQTESSLYLLSSPQSPMRDMLLSIVGSLQIKLSASPDPTAPVAADWNAHYQPLYSLVGQNGRGSDAAQPQPQPGPVPIDAIMLLIERLDNELATGNTAPSTLPQMVTQSADPGQRLLAEAARQPQPVATWLTQIARSGSSSLGQAAKSAASESYNTASGPSSVCHDLIGHYPFDATATDDAPLADFAHVFGPGGALDSYFQANVAPYADTAGPVWHVHSAGGVASPFTDRQLVPFSRAARIRDAFFPAGSQPIVYAAVDLSAPKDLTLGLGSSVVKPGVRASLVWPGADGLAPAVLGQGIGGTNKILLQEQGPWALFRLLGDAIRLSAHSYELTRRGVSLTIAVDAGAGRDPFDPALLAGYTCPSVR